MSSIYDALRRIQGEKGTWAAPRERTEPPARPGKKIVWIVACAVVLSSVCTAGIYYGVRHASERTSVQGAAVQPAPAMTVIPQPQAAPGGQPPAQTAPPGMPPGQAFSPVQAASPAGVPSAPPMAAQPAPPARSASPASPPVPDTVEGYLKEGDRYFLAHDYANALLTYNKALHYFGKDVRVLNNIGSVYMSQGQPDKAIHYFKESNGIAQEYVEPVYNLACAYARLGDPVKAILNLKKACALNPEAKKWAASDPDLKTLKGRRDFDRLVGAQ